MLKRDETRVGTARGKYVRRRHSIATKKGPALFICAIGRGQLLFDGMRVRAADIDFSAWVLLDLFVEAQVCHERCGQP